MFAAENYCNQKKERVRQRVRGYGRSEEMRKGLRKRGKEFAETLHYSGVHYIVALYTYMRT